MTDRSRSTARSPTATSGAWPPRSEPPIQRTERSKLYLNYALDNERGYDGLAERHGSLVVGSRSRLTDSASVYVENQYQHASVTGLTRSMGVTYTPTERWNVSVNWEDGDTKDRRTSAKTERRAGGGSVGYRFEDLNVSSGVEYIFNETEQSDGTPHGPHDLALPQQLQIPDARGWPAHRQVQLRNQRTAPRATSSTAASLRP